MYIFTSYIVDSIFETDKNCYPQTLLEECKYVVKQLKTYITDKMENLPDLKILIEKVM